MTENTPNNDIAANLAQVRATIGEAAEKAGRKASEITLVAVSKTKPDSAVRAALQAGQVVFGENRVQEALGKFPALQADFPALELHLIGPLQTNKGSDAVALFDTIQSLDRPKLARVLAKEMEKQGRRPRLFVQVNTGEEEQKAGVRPAQLADLLALAQDELGLEVAGLMCIPPLDEEPALHFAFLAELAARHGLTGLSMGMSGDYEAAIGFGATHVRVGTAIFGSRG